MNLRAMRFAGLLMGSGMLLAAPAAAQTAAAARSYDMPAQPLGRALSRFTQETGIIVVADANLTRNRMSGAVRGRFTPEQALVRLLRGTGLVPASDGRSGFVLRSAPPKVRKIIAPQRTVAPVETPAAEVASDIVVVGTAPARYYNDDASGVLGMKIPLINLPRTVSVIPEQVFLDQQITQLDEGLRNVSGTSRGTGFGGSYDDVFLRGFRAEVIYRDGRRLGFNQRNPTTQIERVEVLKGPASMLFGAIEPGGVVNIVTKKPLAEPRHFLNATLDSHGKRYLLGDMTGPLDRDGRLLYRVAASYENSDGFRDDAKVRRTVISPSISWRPSDRDQINLSYNFYDESIPLDRGAIVGAFAGGERRIVRTPRARSFGETWTYNKTTSHAVDLDYLHAFSDDWNVTGAVAYQDNRSGNLQVRAWDYFATDTVVAGRSIAAGTLIRNVAGDRKYDVGVIQGSFRLNGRFTVAGIENHLQAGADGGDITTKADSVDGYNETASIRAGGPLFNIFDPVYGNLQPTGLELVRRRDNEHRFRGVFVQDMVELTKGLVVSAGLRRDWYRVISDQQDFSGGLPDGDPVRANRQWAGNSYQLGVSYEFVKGLAVYGSRATSFNIHPYFNDDPRSAPQRGKQSEVGLKGNLLDDRLQFAFSWFDLTKTNIPTFNPDYDGTNQQYNFIGEARSRGIEFDVTVRLAEGLNLIANYADFKYKVTKDNDASVIGKTNANVAPRTANIWGSYELKRGRLQGLGLGTGVNYVSRRWGDDDNSWRIPSYTLWDAGIWYYIPVSERSKLRLQLTVKNITDTHWYIASDGDRFAPSVSIGQPRTALFSAAYQF